MSNLKAKVPMSIWAIGLASLLINISSVIVFGFSAPYLKTILGVATVWIGFLEGMVEACSYLMKVFSGVISDYFRRRKNIMLIGFTMATVARPLLAVSSSFFGVLTSRLLDRIGNGTQSTPRDALVGDIAPDNIKGSCYGLRQSLATAGSFLGGVVGIFAMKWTNNNYQEVFWIATIPAVLALIILFALVKEPRAEKEKVSEKADKPVRQPIRLKDIPLLGVGYWALMIVVGVFMLSRVGEAMLILNGMKNFELKGEHIPFILMVYNAANALISYPIGKLSDRIDRRYILGGGIVMILVADILLSLSPAMPGTFLGMSTGLLVMFVGVAFWGVQIGVTQSMFLALIADIVPEKFRGTSIGIFYLISAVALIIAGSVAGKVADFAGEEIVFVYSSAMAVLSLLTLIFIGKKIKKA